MEVDRSIELFLYILDSHSDDMATERIHSKVLHDCLPSETIEMKPAVVISKLVVVRQSFTCMAVGATLVGEVPP